MHIPLDSHGALSRNPITIPIRQICKPMLDATCQLPRWLNEVEYSTRCGIVEENLW